MSSRLAVEKLVVARVFARGPLAAGRKIRLPGAMRAIILRARGAACSRGHRAASALSYFDDRVAPGAVLDMRAVCAGVLSEGHTFRVCMKFRSIFASFKAMRPHATEARAAARSLAELPRWPLHACTCTALIT